MPTVHRPDCEAHRRSGQISREVESARLQEARDQLQRLQQEATVSVPPAVVASNASPEVVRLQNIVSQLQAQLAKSEGRVVGMVTDGVQESLLKKGRVRPENFVCQTVEEVLEWMDARQSDMHLAVENGNAPEVSRSAQLKSWTLNPSKASNTVG